MNSTHWACVILFKPRKKIQIPTNQNCLNLDKYSEILWELIKTNGMSQVLELFSRKRIFSLAHNRHFMDQNANVYGPLCQIYGQYSVLSFCFQNIQYLHRSDVVGSSKISHQINKLNANKKRTIGFWAMEGSMKCEVTQNVQIQTVWGF